MKNHIISIIVIILFAFCPVILHADSTEHDSKLKTGQWILSLSLGANFEGPSKAIEKVMNASGFGADTAGGTGWFGGGSPGKVYPKSNPVIGGILGLHYMLKSPFAAGILVSFAQGVTKGRHYEGGYWTRDTEIYLDVNYSILTFAPLVSVQASWFKLGVGGALHYIGTYHQRDKCWKLGFLVDSGLIIPFKGKPYFGEVIFQYRSMGEIKIGPYIATEESYSVTFPVSRVNYSHIFVGVGVGIRL